MLEVAGRRKCMEKATPGTAVLVVRAGTGPRRGVDESNRAQCLKTESFEDMLGLESRYAARKREAWSAYDKR